MSEIKKKFVVDRKTWNRGNSFIRSALLNNNGMCCLGFAAVACGYHEDEIFDEERPEKLVQTLAEDNVNQPNRWFGGLVEEIDGEWSGTIVSNAIIITNDDEDISDSLRESKLKKLFNSIGIDVEFVG